MKKITWFPRIRSSKQASHLGRRNGQAMLEFAIVLPIMLVLILGIIEFARVFQAWLVVTNSARAGMRYAVTGAFEEHHCTEDIDLNNNGLVCNQEPDRDIRILEVDEARLLSIYEITEAAAVAIAKDLSIETRGVPGFFHVTVCSSNDPYVYDPPTDTCNPSDHPGDPSTGTERVMVSVTFEHPFIVMGPIANLIDNLSGGGFGFSENSVTLHAERTGILEQFRVARVLGLPPQIDLPTTTPVPTNTSVPVNCDDYGLGTPQIIDTDNRYSIDVFNNDSRDAFVTNVIYDWDVLYEWANASGYHDVNVDWMQWQGAIFYPGNDFTSPTSYIAIPPGLTLPANTTGNLLIDNDYTDEESNMMTSWGIEPSHFGIQINLEIDGTICPYVIAADELPTPEPICDYDISVSNFIPNSNNFYIHYDITNNDPVSAVLENIIIDWDYAENMDLVYDPADPIFLDFISYAGGVIWGEERGPTSDYDSPTNTSVEAPWTWAAPVLFDPGQTYDVGFDFDDEWSEFYSDVVPQDFGLTFNFDNGCVLELAAVERPIVTPEPTCEDIYATFHRLWDDSYEILVRNNNYADAYLVDSTVQWPSPGTSYVDSMDFNWERYYVGNSTAEIVNAAPAPPGILIDGYSYAWWYANFANYGAVLPYGDYSAELIFEYPDAGLFCPIIIEDEILAPTPTPTTDPNATATSTNTLVPTFTNTPVPTQTPIPSSTLTPTNTTEPAPTDTPTPTNTNTPSLTPGDSEPSETPTTIPTEVPTPTPTPTIIIIG